MAYTPPIQEAAAALKRRGLPISLALNRGQSVTYMVGAQTVRAIVRTRHLDGTVTVEAAHELRGGEPFGAYLGFRYRMDLNDLTPEPRT